MDYIDAEEVNEEELDYHVARCMVHDPTMNCEASQPSCIREYFNLNPITCTHILALDIVHPVV